MKKFIEAVAQKGSRLKTPYTIINKVTSKNKQITYFTRTRQ